MPRARRLQAIEAIQKVVAVLPSVGEIMGPLLKRLAEGDWFTSRVSVCSLFAPVYARLTDAARKKEIRECVSPSPPPPPPMTTAV